MKTKVVQIAIGIIALLVLLVCLADMLASSPTSVMASRSSSRAQPALEAPACAPNWVEVSSPRPSTFDNALNGIAAVSATDVWAVGDYYYYNGGSFQTLVEHWDGGQLSIIPSPNLGSSSNYLTGVSAVSATDVWAVGEYFDVSDVSHTLVERWNGSQWNVVSSPSPGTFDNALNGVAAVSATDVWAVGGYSNSSGAGQTLVERWDGGIWSVIPSPNSGADANILNSVAAVSAGDVWAVGYYVYGSVYQTLVEHWNGSIWSTVISLNVGMGSNDLNGIAGVSASDVWAVGYYNNGTVDQTLVEHWDGGQWNVVSSPNSGTHDNALYGIAAVSASDMWAVGYYNNGTVDQTLVEHWDGGQWNVVPSPNVGPHSDFLYQVAAVSATDVWAVGFYSNADVGLDQTLVERYNPCITPSPSPSPSSSPSPISCSTQFTDVPVGSTFYSYVHCLACRNILGGYSSGCSTGNPCLKPGNPVTRGQLAKIVSNSAGYNEQHTTQTFQDVSVVSTFYDFVERLASRNIIGGYACGGVGEPCVPPAHLPYFRPNAPVTRGQTSKIVAIAASLHAPPSGQQTFEDVSPSSTFWQWVESLASAGTIGGYACGGAGEPCIPPQNRPYFRPNNNVTRGQASKIVSNTFFPGCNPLVR